MLTTAALTGFLPLPEVPRFIRGDSNCLVFDSKARFCLSSMRQTRVKIPELDTTVQTSFWRSDAPAKDGESPPRVLLLHGADASSLEWRKLVPRLNELGISTVSVDWWSGGWTDRSAFCEQSELGKTPWELTRQHLRAFWEQELNGEKVVVVGASLGGAVAIDFAASHPEAVAGLVLCDAGGESYASPPAAVVSAMAPVALGVKKALAAVTMRAPSEELRVNSLHRGEPQWAEALGAYLQSGGYARRVDPKLIRTLKHPTLVVWGAEDPILPVQDAYKFQADLQHCAGVHEVPGAGHCPQLDDPDAVASHVAQFAVHGLE